MRLSPPLALAAAAGAGAVQAALWWRGLGPGQGAPAFAWLAVALAVFYAAGVALLWKQTGRRVLLVVVVLGVIFRLAAWTWPPDLSSDLYRYLWDGRVQLAGHSPYQAPPGDPRLASLRDERIWPGINRKEARTVYPPGAQVIWVSLALAQLRSIPAEKAAAIAAELAAMLLLAGALRRRGLPMGRLALYAWCPLVVSEVAVSGHVDAFVLPLLLLGLRAAERRAPVAAGLLLGWAALIKIYPLLLFAAIPREQRVRALAAAAALGIALYGAYFLVSGTTVLGFLPDYVRSGEDFNLGLRGIIQGALAPLGRTARPAAMLICGAALAGYVAWKARARDEDLHAAAGDLALAFVVLLPTAVHPWYAVWMVPFLCIRPSPAGIWLAVALPLSYLKYGAADGEMPPWVTAAIWAPALAALAVHAYLRRRPEPAVAIADRPRPG